VSPSASVSTSASASPSVAAPTDNYDVAILDQNGLDVLQGLGANRDMAASEVAPIIYAGTSLHPYVDETDALTLVISNNLVPSAQVVIELTYALGA